MEINDLSLVQIVRFCILLPANKIEFDNDGSIISIHDDWKMIEFVRGITVHGTVENNEKPTVPTVKPTILQILMKAVSSSSVTTSFLPFLLLDASLTQITEILSIKQELVLFAFLFSSFFVMSSWQFSTEIELTPIFNKD